MKKRLAYLAAALLMTAAFTSLTSCTAFTAPVDPETGIRQDAPADWAGTPNPLDTPETEEVAPPPSMGRFGPHSEYWFH
jgi:hypothetical protein